MGEFGTAEEIEVEGGALAGKASALGRIVMALAAAAVLTTSAAPVSGMSGEVPGGLEGATPVEAPSVELTCEGGCPVGDAGEFGDETSPFPQGYREEDQECTGQGCAVDPEAAIEIDPFTGEVLDRP